MAEAPWYRAPISALILMLAAASCSTPVLPEPSPSPPDWEQTLERAARSVVVLRVMVPRDFDTERARITSGTGFVVDAARGLILTNRHLVQPGPVVAQATFLNHEEVELEAVYRDPVHDFGFYRFDPDDLHYIEVEELPLSPGVAHVGLEVRVVGNDAGEKLSISSGTLARLDRAAPRYGRTSYNDFNTFYYQAASGTTGGSSGSPVIDVQGRVVALNAGARIGSSQSYYLPLERVVRALDYLRADLPVPRGTIETVFNFEAFDQLRRIGLRPDTERLVRAADSSRVGMLVASEVVPGGPADGRLQAGDIVVAVDGQLVLDFLALEERLDDAVAQTVHLEVERGGEAREVELPVADLHALTPSDYIEAGQAVIHPLSYQQARNNNRPVAGLYVADPGYMLAAAGIRDGALIRTLDGRPVPDLDALWEALRGLHDTQRVPLGYVDLAQPDRDRLAVVQMDRRWFPLRRCRRDDSLGTWPCDDAPAPLPAGRLEPRQTHLTEAGPGVSGTLSRSLVMVDTDLPYHIDGISDMRRRGAGLVVDADRGLVVVDRDVVPTTLADVSITFGGSLRVSGHVVYVHPIHNIAAVAYDVADIGSTPVVAARLSSTMLAPGDRVWQVGLDTSHELVWRETQVARILPFAPSLTRRPLFRDHNIDVIDIESAVRTVGGALVDESGAVRALWASFPIEIELQPELAGHPTNPFFHGLPSELIEMVVAPLRRGEPPAYRTLGAELTQMTSADARDLGLSSEWVERFESTDPTRPRVLAVSRVYAGFPSAEVLRGGDLLLAIDGSPITSYLEVDRMSQHESVHLDLLRGGVEVGVDVPTRLLPGRGTDRVVSFAGAVLHAPHLEVAAQRGLDVDGVYVSAIAPGSPARRYGLAPTHLIVEVDGRPTPDLDAFVSAIARFSDGDSIRLRTLSLDRQTRVRTLRLDTHYWPTVEFVLEGQAWERTELSESSAP